MGKPDVKCVLLADRHQGVMEGVRGLLEKKFDAVLMVADTNSLLEGADRLQPLLVVVDLSVFRSGGLDVLRKLHERCPLLKLIVLSMHGEPAVVQSAMEAGANGYVLKSAIGTDLIQGVEAVLAGRKFISPAIPPGSEIVREQFGGAAGGEKKEPGKNS